MSPKKTNTPNYLNVQQVAARYSVGISTVWRWTRDGRLPPPLKLTDRCTRWDQRDLDNVDNGRKP